MTEQNKQIVLKFYEAFDRGVLEETRSSVSSDFVAHLSGLPRSFNFDQFLKFGQAFQSAFPDRQHTFDDVTIEGDRVLTRGTFSGTHRGEFMGIAPTGKQITIAVQHIDRVVDGKIIEHWGKGDQLGLMRQIGVMAIAVGLINSVRKRLLRSS